MRKALISCLVLLAFIGCNKGNKGEVAIVFKSEDGPTLAEVGGVKFSLNELRNDFLERQGQFKGAPNLNTDKARNDYIESHVMQEAMFQEAIAEGFAERSDVKRNIKKIVVQAWMRAKLDEAQNTYEPTEAEIKEHYEKHANLYKRDEAVKVAYIAIPKGPNPTKTKEIATKLQKEAVLKVKNGNTKAFVRLAAQYAPQLSNMGMSNISLETNESDYLEKTAFDTKFGANSFEIAKGLEQAGQIAPVIVTDNAYFVMMKSGFRKSLDETIEDAKPKIVKRLSYENRGKIYKEKTEGLRKKYDVKVHAELVADLSKGAIPPNSATASSDEAKKQNENHVEE